MTALEARAAIRAGTFAGPTERLAPEHVQANLVVVPSEYADELADLCARNPVPCPLLERLAPGAFEPRCARGADLRTDLGRYRVWRDGELAEQPRDVRAPWSEEVVAFLIGCSFTFDHALARAGLSPRHYALRRNVPMYRTRVPLAPAGRLHGTMVVSMRPYQPHDVERVRHVTRAYRIGHGEPVAWGDPAQLGIDDVMRPDYGDPPVMEPGDVPVFWGCGVTPQSVIVASKVPFAITHEPGDMFVTDLVHAELAAQV
ncbi:MAG TPA: putative hydro-lyase [Candidatus Elarobacter sp.]|nr:putative hydro-lyase [Dongiaceae bacterium]HZW53743.1 putative hydro-lyase [Candidatus Elarobacter sp.]